MAIQNEIIDEMARGLTIAVSMKILFGGRSVQAVFSQSTLMDAVKYGSASIAYRYVGRPVVAQITGMGGAVSA